MKTLGINIDGVIRDFHSQFDKQYRKMYIHNPSLVAMDDENMTFKAYTEEEEKTIEERIKDRERELITLPVDSSDLLNHYKFDSKTIKMSKLDTEEGIDYTPIEMSPKQNLEDFMYETYPYQIFGMAPEYPGAMDTVNKIQFMGLSKGLFDVVLFTTLKSKAITSTYAFLGSVNCRIKTIKHLNSDSEKWNHCDAVVDIVPTTFQTKPADKVSIKINHPFNQWDAADYSYNSIKEICNEEFFNRIFKTT